jgi:uncharacterized RDD family membrane protein YckC
VSAYPAQAAAADPTAVMGRRIAAFVIDILIVNVITWAVFFALAETGDADRFSCDSIPCVNINDTLYSPGGVANFIYWVVAIGIPILLFVVLQGLKGITPGKAILGVRTVNEQGEVPGILKALVRWLLLIVDFSFCFLIGLILALTTKGHRRLGDMAAKTFVVGKADAGRPVVVPGLTTAAPAPMAPAAVGAPGAAPPAAAPPGAAPVAPAAAPGTEAQWDPARNAYIQWDPNQQQWLQFDDAIQQWRPIDQ